MQNESEQEENRESSYVRIKYKVKIAISVSKVPFWKKTYCKELRKNSLKLSRKTSILKASASNKGFFFFQQDDIYRQDLAKLDELKYQNEHFC